MARFLVTYHGSEMSHEPEAMALAREAFMVWAAKTGEQLVEPGSPVASMVTITATGRQAGPAEGPVNGWSVIEAADADAVLDLLADHPFLGRGGALQVNEPAGI